MRTISALFLLLAIAAGLTFYSHKLNHKVIEKELPKSPLARQLFSTHRLGLDDFLEGDEGHCSGTAVSPHVILTAGHCISNSNHIQIDFNVGPSTILAMTSDGHDHVLLLVDENFEYYSEIEQRTLVEAEPVHFWGAPGKNNSVYRDGYYSGLCIDTEDLKKEKAQLFIIAAFPGDSGSGIFDEDGHVIAVVSLADKSSDTVTFPLSFTPHQLSLIQ